MSDLSVVRKDCETTFKYLQWDNLFLEEKPFEILMDLPDDAPDKRKTNLNFHDGSKEIVRDVRGNFSRFELDKHGFTYVKHKSQVLPTHFKTPQIIEDTYLPECEALLKKHLRDVDQVFCYNWRLRCSDDSASHGTMINFGDLTHPLGPATHVHVDQSPAAIVERVGMYLPEQEDFLLRGRVQHVNIWRPINGPVQASPLAVCDGRSILTSSLVETDRIKQYYAGCTLFSLYQPGYLWYYASNQNDDEPLLFKSFDSRNDVTRYAGHGAFQLPAMDSKPPPRESIEVRALVFTYPKDV